MNISDVARECSVNRKLAEGYFDLAEDLLLAVRVPCFRRRAKRTLSAHPKFYYFDAGIYRSLSPSGLLDTEAEADGPALETLFLAEVRALNDYLGLKYQIYTWRTRSGTEVDFILYGPRGFHAFEIKRSETLSKKDFRGLGAFAADYPEASRYLLYGGKQPQYDRGIQILPMEATLKRLKEIL